MSNKIKKTLNYLFYFILASKSGNIISIFSVPLQFQIWSYIMYILYLSYAECRHKYTLKKDIKFMRIFLVIRSKKIFNMLKNKITAYVLQTLIKICFWMNILCDKIIYQSRCYFVVSTDKRLLNQILIR